MTARPQPHAPRRRIQIPAFTLLEVLVVVAIILLLVAVLLPSLQRARVSSRHTVCQHNLHEIGCGWQMYLTANTEHFPQTGGIQVTFGGKQGTTIDYQGPRPVNRYLNLPPVTWQDTDYFHCPLDAGASFAQPSCYKVFGTSYLANIVLTGQLTLIPGDPCKKITQETIRRARSMTRNNVDHLEKVPIAGDYGWFNTWSIGMLNEPDLDWHPRPRSYNFAFLDGHVSFVGVRKGIIVCDRYAVYPFGDLQEACTACQKEK